MGCCFSKKPKKHPSGSAASARHSKTEYCDPPLPEEEKVKEVLSETTNTKVRAEAKPVANVVAVEEQEVVKVKASVDAIASVSDLGSCVSFAADERSEAASELSAATSSVTGPERSPGKLYMKRPVSGELGLVRRNGAVASYSSRSRSYRASPSPPPRREPRDRSVRRSPSPAAKRPPPEQHRNTSLQRKPPVPTRPSSHTSPRRAWESLRPPPPVPQPVEEYSVPVEGENSIAEAIATAGSDGRGDGEGKESLENPLVSMECFIFL